MNPSESAVLCRTCGTPLPGGKWSDACPRCLIEAFGEEEVADPASSLVGGYTILEEIARGGMGVVYRARQHHPSRVVALKMILPHLLDSALIRARFQAEAESVAKLDHPNVLPIYEAGEHRGTPYLAMKFVPGGSVAAQREKFRGAPRDCAELVAAASRGVQHAHERGILHRDLKPANLLLDHPSAEGAAPVPMVSDFGLARILESEASGLTAPSALLGTAGYVAPELAFGHHTAPTVQTDIYSLGAILYELITGRLPFGEETGLQALRRADQEAPPALRTLDPRVPRDLDAICLKCLQREPSSRYNSAAALASDLQRFIEGRPVMARPVPRTVLVTRWARRKPALATLSVISALLLVAALVGAVFFTQRVARERDRAAASEKHAQAQLWRAYLEQARATHIAPQMGRRFAALEVIAAAARIRPSLELRNAAAAALVVDDIVLERRWPDMRTSIDTPVAFDANIERYALPQPGGRISIRRVSDNHELVNFAAREARRGDNLLFSPDGRFLAGRYADGETWLWQVADAASPVLKLAGAEPFSQPAFTPDGSTFVASDRAGELGFYDLKGAVPHEVGRWVDLPSIHDLAFDPSGQRLAVTSPEGAVAEIRETNTGRVLHRLAHPVPVTGVGWHPGGTELATGSQDLHVRIWDAASGTLLHLLEGHENVPMRPVYHPGSRILATAGWDAVLRFWASNSGNLLFNGPACYDWQRFSADGSRLGVANYDGAVEIYHVPPRKSLRICAPQTRLSGRLVHHWLDFSPDSRWISATGDERVRVWDVAAAAERARLPLPGAVGVTTLFTGDSASLFIADEVSGVTRTTLPPTTGEPSGDVRPETLRSGEDFTTRLRTRDGGIVLVNSALGMAEIVSPQESATRRIGPHARMNRVALSPDGKRIATGTWRGMDIKIWDTASGELLATLPTGENAAPLWQSAHTIVSVQLTGAGQWLEDPSTGEWRRGQTWLPDTGGNFWIDAALSPDGRHLALPQSGDRVRLLDMTTGAELITLEAPKPFGLGFVRFSPDGRSLAASGAREQVAIWDLPELRRELATLGLDWAD